MQSGKWPRRDHLGHACLSLHHACILPEPKLVELEDHAMRLCFLPARYPQGSLHRRRAGKPLAGNWVACITGLLGDLDYFSGFLDGAVPSHHVPCASAQREEIPRGEIGSKMQTGLLLAGSQLNGDFLQTGAPVGFLNAVV